MQAIDVTALYGSKTDGWLFHYPLPLPGRDLSAPLCNRWIRRLHAGTLVVGISPAIPPRLPPAAPHWKCHDLRVARSSNSITFHEMAYDRAIGGNLITTAMGITTAHVKTAATGTAARV